MRGHSVGHSIPFCNAGSSERLCIALSTPTLQAVKPPMLLLRFAKIAVPCPLTRRRAAAGDVARQARLAGGAAHQRHGPGVGRCASIPRLATTIASMRSAAAAACALLPGLCAHTAPCTLYRLAFVHTPPHAHCVNPRRRASAPCRDSLQASCPLTCRLMRRPRLRRSCAAASA